jgi:LmbE family N-acetylglucosaminyl deacetylase/SAM-dependent methyltransferase
MAARSGGRVSVVVASDGENSHPNSPTVRPGPLAGRRRREVCAALNRLAPTADLQFLGLPDGQLTEHRPELVAALARLDPPPTLLAAPWVGDQHPDHAACALAAADAASAAHARLWQYPIWAWHWADPDDGSLPTERLRGLRLDDRTRRAKIAALECHESQHQALSPAAGDEPILGPGMLEHFHRPVEVFVVNDTTELVSRAYFDDLYSHDADPWGLRERFYEQRKRAVLVAALTRPRFRRAFEPGCATGLLTADLARRCDEVVAWDITPAAVEQARARTRDLDGVRIDIGTIPDEWPAGPFDLVVISEIGYYCTDLSALVARIDGCLAPDGLLVACHWRHSAPMHPHTAGAVHAALAGGRHLVLSHVEDDFLLQAWTPDATSVAAAEGITP